MAHMESRCICMMMDYIAKPSLASFRLRWRRGSALIFQQIYESILGAVVGKLCSREEESVILCLVRSVHLACSNLQSTFTYILILFLLQSCQVGRANNIIILEMKKLSF